MVINMPVRKQDAYRALELLEDYYNRLDKPEDKPLKTAIDRYDIQEFYESILLDDRRDLNSKMNATMHLADEWEKRPLLNKDDRTGTPPLLPSDSINTRYPPPAQRSAPLGEPLRNKILREQQQPSQTHIDGLGDETRTHPSDVIQFNYEDHWRDEEIYLERSAGVGLGFSIAGGSDTPCINDSPSVVVTRITENGIAAKDNRLRLHDIILRVNDIDFTNINHAAAVEALKNAGNKVTLYIRRLVLPYMEEIELQKSPNSTLGFSIAGGISHEHVKGDHGIFITNIIQGGIADQNGRLKVGDRLIHVSTPKHNYDLQFVEHKHAVESIRRACDESDEIKLTVGHPSTVPNTNGYSTPINGQVHHEEQMNGDKDRDNYGIERRVVLRRGSYGFGFNIVGGDTDEGIFISFIQAGGPADKSGNLQKGDRIMSVNQNDLRGASHEDAANVLKNCGDTADMIVSYRPDDYVRFESRIHELRDTMMGGAGSTGSLKTSTKRQFFVRAEFDYDPGKDSGLPDSNRGLSFRAGDILHVTNAADDQWWKARRVQYDGSEEDLGIIPSKKRVEKKERSRQKRVNFNQSGSRSNTLDRDKAKKKKKFGLFGKGGDNRKETQSGDDTDNEPDNLEPVASYELVTQHELNHTRPVIIFGPFKEIINDQLMNDKPDKFVNCVPHTTRPRRDKEINGRDYHFVPSREQMEEDIQNHLFIEAGEYKGNLYGTSVQAVKAVSESVS
ncbi:unnamed protein product [Didymodactylos carnosus]|uniref:Uncharacterized protein n=1 Tax=Didymodactylos carnosus TaxID=1234261 RepID=A0A8S2D3J0_9BILA|nr:unnamed protein product [Didymodactylos carnosus]CAF3618441.1 unnamed protein product [Didymodactylos carnosus]